MELVKPGLIAVAIIVRNEEVMLEACLKSVSNADEIVVVDTGSDTEETMNIAKRFTDKVFRMTECNDEQGRFMNFSLARNFAASKCDAPWILVIDADERIESDWKTKLEYILTKKGTEKLFGVEVEVHTAREVGSQVRLYNKKNVQFFDACHNWLGVQTTNGIRRLSEFPDMLYKTGVKIMSDYSPAHIKDPDRTLRILTAMLKQNPSYCRAMFYMARERINRGEEEAAAYWLLKYIASNPELTNELAEVYFMLAATEMDKYNYLKAREYLFLSISLFPQVKAPWRALAALYSGDEKMRTIFERIENLMDGSGAMFIKR